MCPTGYLPCNENVSLTDANSQYVMCRPADKTIAEYCPITDFSFYLSSVNQNDRPSYTEVKLLKNGSTVQNRSIWYSKSVIQHGINNIRVQASKPC